MFERGESVESWALLASPGVQLALQGNPLRRCTVGVVNFFNVIEPSVRSYSSFNSLVLEGVQGLSTIPLAKPGMLIAGRFEVNSIIGRGTFCCVQCARDLYTGQSVALKLVHRGFATLGRREVMILRLLCTNAKLSERALFPELLGSFEIRSSLLSAAKSASTEESTNTEFNCVGLALPLYRCTLYQVIQSSKTQTILSLNCSQFVSS